MSSLGSRITTDGLICSIDVNNRKSYLGTGSVVSNLSDRNNNGILINFPTNLISDTTILTVVGATLTYNYATSPDGKKGAIMVANTPSIGSYFVWSTTNVVSGITYTVSFYGKSDGNNSLLYFESFVNNQFAVNLNTNSFVGGWFGSNVKYYDIVNVGDGWFRYIVTFTTQNTYSFNPAVYIGVYGNTATQCYAQVFGFQVEVNYNGFVPTNLIPYSTCIGTSGWNGYNPATLVLNDNFAPDGTFTATRITNIFNNSGGYHQLIPISKTAGTSFTYSIYGMRAPSNDAGVWIQVDLIGGANATVSYNSGIFCSVGVWSRLSYTFTLDYSDRTSIRVMVGNGNTLYIGATAGAGTSVYVWGAQLELGTSTTNLIRSGFLVNEFASNPSSGYLVLNGSNQYIVSNSSSLGNVPNISHFTWFYPTKAGIIVDEIGQPDQAAVWHDANIEIDSVGAIRFATWTGGGLSTPVVSPTQSFNSWYNLGMTYNGTFLTAYLNGVSIGTSSFSRGSPTNQHYAIGAGDVTKITTASYGCGKFATFNVYNKALSSAEVLQNYNNQKGRFGL